MRFVRDLAAQGLRQLLHASEGIGAGFAADGDPGDSGGKGLADRGVAAEFVSQYGFAYSAHALNGGDCDVGAVSLGQYQVTEIADEAGSWDVVLGEVR